MFYRRKLMENNSEYKAKADEYISQLNQNGLQLSEKEKEIIYKQFQKYGRPATMEEIISDTEANIQKMDQAQQKMADAKAKIIESYKKVYRVGAALGEDHEIYKEDLAKLDSIYSKGISEKELNQIKQSAKKALKKEEFQEKVLGGPERDNLEKIARLRKITAKYPQEEFFKDELNKAENKVNNAYEAVNPELGRLRKEEKEEIAKGVDPKEAQKKRRTAVKAHYNKQSIR